MLNIKPNIVIVFFIAALCSAPLYADQIPEEILSLPLHEWRSISLNTIADVDPCPQRNCAWSGIEGQVAVVDAWNGGIYASGLGVFGSLIYAGGGHNAYYGNEIYAFDFETLRWSRLNAPTDGKEPGNAATMMLDENCRFWDDSPVMPHTYDSVTYEPDSNRLYLLTPEDADSYELPGRGNGCYSTIPAYFDFDTNTWGNMQSAGPASLIHGPTAYDKKRKLFWGRTGFRAPRLLVSYNPERDLWRKYEDDAINIDAMGAIDPVRDLFVTAIFRYEPLIAVIDLSNPSRIATKIKTKGAKAIEKRAGLGFEWADRLGGFIAWNDGKNLYLLTPPESDWRTREWTWSVIEATGEDPGVAINGAYSKFQWIDELGIAVIAPSHTSPVYAVRLAK